MTWETKIKPVADRFELVAKLGLDVRTTPDAALATADALRCLARYADAMEARLAVQRRLLLLADGLATVALVVALVWLLA